MQAVLQEPTGPGGLEYFVQTDPVVNIGYQKQQQLLSAGAQVVNLQRFPSTARSNQSVSFICNPPNRKIITDRVVYVRFRWTLTFTGEAKTPLLLLGVADAVRQFPSLSIMNTINVNINGVQVQTQPYKWVNALMSWYQNNKLEPLSGSPNMPDMYQAYSDVSSLGSERSALGIWGDNSAYVPRGTTGSNVVGASATGYYVSVTNNVAGQASVTFDDYFPIPVSPFLFSGQDIGLTQVETMNVTITMNNNFHHLWSHSSSGNTISTINANLDEAEIFLRFLTPEPQAPTNMDILERPVYYDFQKIQDYIKQLSEPVVIGQQNFEIVSDSLQLGTIPQRLYVYCRRAQQSGVPAAIETDTFARLEGLTIQWNNNTFLSQATSHQLYEMSVKNGLKMPYPGWRSFCGSVCAVEFGSDIGLYGDEFQGKKGSFNLRVTGRFSDIRLGATPDQKVSPVQYEMYILTVEAGMLSLLGSGSALYTGFDLGDRFKELAQRIDLVQDNELFNYPQQVGGSFFKKIGSFFKKAADHVLPIAKLIPGVAPIASAAEQLINTAKSDPLAAVQQGIDMYKQQVGSGLHHAPLLGGYQIAGRLKGGYQIAGRMKKKKSKKGRRGGCMDCGDDQGSVGHMTVSDIRSRLHQLR